MKFIAKQMINISRVKGLQAAQQSTRTESITWSNRSTLRNSQFRRNIWENQSKFDEILVENKLSMVSNDDGRWKIVLHL